MCGCRARTRRSCPAWFQFTLELSPAGTVIAPAGATDGPFRTELPQIRASGLVGAPSGLVVVVGMVAVGDVVVAVGFDDGGRGAGRFDRRSEREDASLTVPVGAEQELATSAMTSKDAAVTAWERQRGKAMKAPIEVDCGESRSVLLEGDRRRADRP